MANYTKICVDAKELLKTLLDIYKDEPNAIEIAIGPAEDFETGETYKAIHFSIIESGGFGCVDGYDSVRELTEDELLDIP